MAEIKSGFGEEIDPRSLSKKLFDLRQRGWIQPDPNNTGDRLRHRWLLTVQGIEKADLP